MARKPFGRCPWRKRQKNCNGRMKKRKRLCKPEELPDPCSCNRCIKCPEGTKVGKILVINKMTQNLYLLSVGQKIDLAMLVALHFTPSVTQWVVVSD